MRKLYQHIRAGLLADSVPHDLGDPPLHLRRELLNRTETLAIPVPNGDEHFTHMFSAFNVQGDPSGWSTPPVYLVLPVPATSGPLLQLPTAQAAWRNIPNLSQQDVFTVLNSHPVKQSKALCIT